MILVRVFIKEQSAEREFLESIIFGSSFLGMMGSIYYTYYIAKKKIPKNIAIAIPSFVSSVLFVISMISDNPYAYIITVASAFFCIPLRLPSITSIYHENYPALRRGMYTSFSLILYQLATVGFYYLAGYWLDLNLDNYKLILGCLAFSSLISGLLSYHFPTEKFLVKTHKPLSAFKWIYKDKLFGYLLFVWFIFGFANLWVIPIKLSYLTDKWNLTASSITLILGIIPEITRLVFLPFWAYLFDRINFIILRIALNVFLALGIGVYFFADSLFLLGLGSFLHGVGFSGGRLAWGLWVTKIVPEERTAEYMSVHVSLTGIRGFIGPMIGYYVLTQLRNDTHQEYTQIASISVGLIVISILLMLPIRKLGRLEK